MANLPDSSTAPPGAPESWLSDHVDPLLALALHQNEVHAVALADAEGMIRWCNAACERTFGYRRSALVGRPLEILFNRQDIDAGVPEWEKNVTGLRHRSEDDRWMERADGSGVYVAGTLQALHDETGELVGFAKVMRNRTDAHEHALSLRRQRDDAIQALATHRADCDRVAHRLQASLSAIGLVATVLRQLPTQDDIRIQSVIATLERQAATMTYATDQLLEAANASASRGSPRRAPLMLQPLLGKVTQAAASAGLAQLVAIRGSMWVMGDEARLQRAFELLLDHALGVTPPERPSNIRITFEGPDGVVRIEDHGAGLTPDEHARIFELFTGSPGLDEDRADGVDPRLSEAHRIVTAHAGTVQVLSDGPGTGCTITVRLPLLDTDLIDEAGQLREAGPA